MNVPDSAFNLPVTGAALARALPQLRYAHPVVLAFSGLWTAGPDGKLRPEFRLWRMATGLHSIGEAMAGNLQRMFTKISEQAGKRNQTLIPFDACPPELGSYLRKYQGFDKDLKTENAAYRLAWEKVSPNTPDVVVDYVLLDRYVAVWQELGLIPEAPAQRLVQRRVRDLDRKVSNLRRSDPELRGWRAKAMSRELRAWEAYLEGSAFPAVAEEIEPEEEPTPPPAAKPSPKPATAKAPAKPKPTKAAKAAPVDAGVNPISETPAPDEDAPGMVAED